MIKVIEFVGVFSGIIGSFLVARGFLPIGFCLFLLSSICLCYSAVKQKNWNLTLLQSAFLLVMCLVFLIMCLDCDATIY